MTPAICSSIINVFETSDAAAAAAKQFDPKRLRWFQGVSGVHQRHSRGGLRGFREFEICFRGTRSVLQAP